MRKANERKKRSGWKFKVTKEAVYEERGFLGLTFRKCVDVFYNSAKAITYDFELDEAKQPKFDKNTSYQFILSEVFKQKGKGLKTQLPALFWVLVIMVGFSIVLQFYFLAQFLGL